MTTIIQVVTVWELLVAGCFLGAALAKGARLIETMLALAAIFLGAGAVLVGVFTIMFGGMIGVIAGTLLVVLASPVLLFGTYMLWLTLPDKALR